MYALAATEAVGSIAYLLLACTGIAVSAFLWDRLAAIERTRGAPASREGGLMLVYAAALVGGAHWREARVSRGRRLELR